MLNVIINGAAGKMGKANIAVFNELEDFTIVGAIEAENSACIGLDAGTVAGIGEIGTPITVDFEGILDQADVVIDFTNPESAIEKITCGVRHKTAFVIGTTGFSEDQRNTIQSCAETIPILLSPNMSLGINTLFYLVQRAVEILGPEYDAEIVEIHHNMKKDAPSGTALQFGRIIAETRGLQLDDVAVFGRSGQSGPRKSDEIGILALRAADIIGDHTVLFAGSGERVELVHRNSSRRTYATGAARAARYIVEKDHGLYSMEDVLGLT